MKVGPSSAKLRLVFGFFLLINSILGYSLEQSRPQITPPTKLKQMGGNRKGTKKKNVGSSFNLRKWSKNPFFKFGLLGLSLTSNWILPTWNLMASSQSLATFNLEGIERTVDFFTEENKGKRYELIFPEGDKVEPFINPTKIPEHPIEDFPDLEVNFLPQGLFLESGDELDPNKNTILHVHGWNPDGKREEMPDGMDEELWGDWNRLRYFWDQKSFAESAPPTGPEVWSHVEGIKKLKAEMIRLRKALPEDYDQELRCVAHSAGSAMLLITNYILLSEGSDAACDRIELLDPWVDQNLILPLGSPLYEFAELKEFHTNKVAPIVKEISSRIHRGHGVPVTVYNSVVSYFSGFSDVKQVPHFDGTQREIYFRNKIWPDVHNVNLTGQKTFVAEVWERFKELLDRAARQEAIYWATLRHSQAVEYYYNSMGIKVELENSNKDGITASLPTDKLKNVIRLTTRQNINYEEEEAKIGERQEHGGGIKFYLQFQNGRTGR